MVHRHHAESWAESLPRRLGWIEAGKGFPKASSRSTPQDLADELRTPHALPKLQDCAPIRHVAWYDMPWP